MLNRFYLTYIISLELLLFALLGTITEDVFTDACAATPAAGYRNNLFN